MIYTQKLLLMDESKHKGKARDNRKELAGKLGTVEENEALQGFLAWLGMTT
jgi:hypothetical protein